MGIFFKDKGAAKVRDNLNLSDQTIRNYQKSWPLSQQQLNGLYNRLEYFAKKEESSKIGRLYPGYVAENQKIREKLQTSAQDMSYEDSVAFPEPGMVVSSFPHSFLLLTEMAWMDIPHMRLCPREVVQLEFQKTRIGSGQSEELTDLYLGMESSKEIKDAFLVLLDVWVLSAAIEDLEHITDCKLVEPCVLSVIDRHIGGESVEALTKWSIQQFWKGNEFTISWTDFPHEVAKKLEVNPDGVMEKVRAWQKGRPIKGHEIGAIKKVVGIKQMIPMLVVAFIRSTNLFDSGRARPSWDNLDLAGAIHHWRAVIRQAARDTPGITINPRGTFYLKPDPDQSPAE